MRLGIVAPAVSNNPRIGGRNNNILYAKANSKS